MTYFIVHVKSNTVVQATCFSQTQLRRPWRSSYSMSQNDVTDLAELWIHLLSFLQRHDACRRGGGGSGGGYHCCSTQCRRGRMVLLRSTALLHPRVTGAPSGRASPSVHPPASGLRTSIPTADTAARRGTGRRKAEQSNKAVGKARGKNSHTDT